MFNPTNNGHVAQHSVEKYYGKYPGIVVDNAPPEDAAHRGELLVQVPGILEETPNGASQQPIEVVAKPCFVPGFFFIPENESRVWVEFIAGDINQPVWTGVWYPTDTPPHTTAGEGPTEFQKIIRTASGHVIQMDDTEGEETIIIQHKDGMTIELKADNSVTITANVTVEGMLQVTGDTTIDGELTVGTDPSTTIKGNEITGG